MERVNGTSHHVPAFLAKLWRIVDDPSLDDLICWSKNGNSFIIRNQAQFARELLPLYYKHNNMASFVRQLNMYGFHKVISVEQGGLRADKDEMEFAHRFFLRGDEDSLEFIKRKIATSKIEDIEGRPESLNKVLMDVKQMKGRQEVMDSKLGSVKRENEALWRELTSLRHKHAKQQQIVSKLLQFLVSMMSSQSHRIIFKRRMPLMLNDVDEDTIPAKSSRPTVKAEEATAESNNGAVIHEVFEQEPGESGIVFSPASTNESQQLEKQSMSAADDGTLTLNSQLFRVEDLLSRAAAETIDDSYTNPSPVRITDVKDGSPELTNKESDYFTEENLDFGNAAQVEENLDFGNVNVPIDKNLELATPQMDLNAGSPVPTANNQLNVVPAVTHPLHLIRNDFDGHLDDVQVGLDGLKDLLQGDSYNIDNATLSGLFGDEDDLPLFELTGGEGEADDISENPFFE